MIHTVYLSETIRKKLTDIVHLQFAFLRYASCINHLDQNSCQKYFRRHPRFKNNHSDIAEWLWDGSRKGTLKLLQTFATGATKEKRLWCKNLYYEAIEFLKDSFSLSTLSACPTQDEWQKKGADFLRKFYEIGLGKETSKFSMSFFTELSATFGRKEFLACFEKSNPNLKVCPACDLDSYSQIDHYFPQESYPHLSCHPYNLVYICSTCNTKYKNTKIVTNRKVDNSALLENIFLPYRDKGLSEITYLKMSLEQDHKKLSIMGLEPFANETKVRETIEGIQYLFSIPDRWNQKYDTFVDLVFSQLKQNMDAHKASGGGCLNIFNIRDKLDSILCSFSEDLGCKNWCFSMTWYLAILINHKVDPTIIVQSYPNYKDDQFLHYLATLLKQDSIPHPAYISNERLEKARELRKKAQ